MDYHYPVAKPSITEKEHAYISDAVKSGWVSSQGKYVQAFENQFAAWNKYKHGVACSSGTAALTLALRALHIKKGDEVIVPEFTMIASAWAVSYTGAKPVFVDCKEDLNIDPDILEQKITEKTKAIMPVHIYGRRCAMDAIMDIAHNYNLHVVEDSAEAHGVRPVGDIACFSLYGNKIVTSGEGGVCVTNDPRLARQMAHLRAMAFSTDHNFVHKKIAYNFRMTNMQAALAKAQLERVDELLAKRREIEQYYDERLKNLANVRRMPKRDVVWFYDLLVENRAALQQHLAEKGIETRQFFKPMSQQPMYYNENWKQLKAAQFGHAGIYLPTYVDLTRDDQEYIVKQIESFYRQNPRP